MLTIQLVSDWFKTNKAPQLSDQVQTVMKGIEEGFPLNEQHKRFLGFMLFSYSMNHGPSTFLLVQDIAEELGVEEDVKHWSEDWIKYSKEKKEENAG